jgi:FlaA1/EpsC-like NDP-sugar epimerase
MGMTKRLAEIALLGLNGGTTRFSGVRFGNVLGSSGSVVPLFKEQIARGGPVTVTHPDMKRYFMTVQEAVALVLKAATFAEPALYVLDMGEPVKIVDLAEEMIAEAGLRPYVDVPIVFTGIRPGEKLFEELDVSEKSVLKTGCARIYVCRDSPACSPDEAVAFARSLVDGSADDDSIRRRLREWAKY